MTGFGGDTAVAGIDGPALRRYFERRGGKRSRRIALVTGATLTE